MNRWVAWRRRKTVIQRETSGRKLERESIGGKEIPFSDNFSNIMKIIDSYAIYTSSATNYL